MICLERREMKNLWINKSKAKYKTIDDMPILDRSSKKEIFTDLSENQCNRMMYLANVIYKYMKDLP